ncbi:MAG: GspE/PulE family protein [Fibrobacterales bacterium]
MSEEKKSIVASLGLKFCREHKCYPLKFEDSYIDLAVINEFDELLFSAVYFKTGHIVRPKLTEESAIDELLSDSKSKSTSNDSLLQNLDEAEINFDDESSDIDEIKKHSQSQPVINLANNLINQGIEQGATDIHIESLENEVVVRFRKDGMLRKSLELPSWVRAALVSRLKILAELDISEKRLPQDGRIKWNYHGEEIDMRVSSLPTKFGEKIVLRILKYMDTLKQLENLGMSDYVLKRLQFYFTRPQGMIFVTGPTGSGKSSTLFAGLQHVINKEINITTIEDPIEYHLKGANQVQVNEKAGLTFSSVLRSLLRQDPDVILLGEIRDTETAQIAVQAAQTGHLVLSTLHTNDAMSAITRLVDLNIPSFLIGSSVLCVLAQRLVRKLCPHCYSMIESSDYIKSVVPNVPLEVPQAVGCERCDHTGYNGRLAVFELLEINQEIKEIISETASEVEIRKRASFDSMIEDGLSKLKQNLTSISEIERVLLR